VLEEAIKSWAKRSPLPSDLVVNRPNPLATFWTQNTTGVNYYRATLPARYLPGKTCSFNIFDVKRNDNPLEPEIVMPRQEGAAVWMFPGNNTRAILIAELQEQGIPCWFECDDNYTIRPDLGKSDWLDTYQGDDRHSFEIASKIAAFCDGVICSTPRLAEVYSGLNDNVHVARNCIDPGDWDDLDKPDDGILRIGWAASASHAKDARLIKKALSWLSRKDDVEIIILGIQPIFPFSYTHITWTEKLSDYRKLLQVLDIMLCPVQRTNWSDCKSDVKAMEGAMAGAMAVVSESPSYDLWADRTYVCKTEDDWVKAAKHLYRNRDEIRKLQNDHREYVLSERTIQKGVEAWRQALKTV
jgi:hypothetical protein